MFPGKCFVLPNALHMNGILPWQRLEENGGSCPLCPWIVLGLGRRVVVLFSEFLPSILKRICICDLSLGDTAVLYFCFENIIRAMLD